MTAKVTLEDVERVAELAHIQLEAGEVPRMIRDLSAILDYVAQLNELDTEDVEPLAQIGELLLAGQGARGLADGSGEAAGSNFEIPALRPDVVLPSLDRALAMAEAPETDGTFFKVPKVIER